MFNATPFVSHSGLKLSWKLDCDSLTDNDWACLAKIVADSIHFKEVYAVPTGGVKFAEALKPRASKVSAAS